MNQFQGSLPPVNQFEGPPQGNQFANPPRPVPQWAPQQSPFNGAPDPSQGPFAGASRRKRRLGLPSGKRGRLLLGAGAVAVIAVVVAASVAVFSGSSSSTGDGTAGGAVKAYLEALAKGDAAGALALVKAKAPDKTFLTDEILKKQVEKYPITNIKILGDIPNPKGRQTVHVTADFGGVPSDGLIGLEKPAQGEIWKLDNGITALDFTKASSTRSKDLLDMLTLFGKPVPKSGKAYVFPGWAELATTNPNIAVTNHGEGPPNLGMLSSDSELVFPDFKLSDTGRQEILDAIKKIAEDCAKSTKLMPPKCPIKEYYPDAVEDSAQWTAPTDYSALEISDLDFTKGTVRIDGDLDFQVSFRSQRNGAQTDTVNANFWGTADILQSPPKIDLN